VRPQLRVLAFLSLVVSALAVHALDVPPPPQRWVTDQAGVLSTTDLGLLDSKLENFEQTQGVQFLIYTFRSIEGESIEDFTQRCVERWKVGRSKYDNGLVLFVFVAERKVRIEVGYGLEGTVTDAISSRVIREQIAPFFQKGDYGGGLNAAANALMARIRGGEAPVPPQNPRTTPVGGPQGAVQPGGFDIGTLVFIAIFVIFFVVPLLSRRRRGSGCGGCILPFFLGGGGSGITFGGGGGGFGGGFGGGGGGGFSGGGGRFGGGGATGGW
jgi:uncharacterized protein